jgi:CHASE3 domain sensor protein
MDDFLQMDELDMKRETTLLLLLQALESLEATVHDPNEYDQTSESILRKNKLTLELTDRLVEVYRALDEHAEADAWLDKRKHQ